MKKMIYILYIIFVSVLPLINSILEFIMNKETWFDYVIIPTTIVALILGIIAYWRIFKKQK